MNVLKTVLIVAIIFTAGYVPGAVIHHSQGYDLGYNRGHEDGRDAGYFLGYREGSRFEREAAEEAGDCYNNSHVETLH